MRDVLPLSSVLTLWCVTLSVTLRRKLSVMLTSKLSVTLTACTLTLPTLALTSLLTLALSLLLWGELAAPTTTGGHRGGYWGQDGRTPSIGH